MEEKSAEYDFSQVPIKREGSAPLSNVSPVATPLTTWPYSLSIIRQSFAVSPSQLHTSLKRRSSSPGPSISSEPTLKKAKRKARTEEEKEARAYERTMRNRRAAQESRDRKKRQFEVLEEENRRLHEENLQMKRRIEQLESHHQQLQIQQTFNFPVAIKQEEEHEFSPESFESTFHPAVMEFNSDQQCLSNSLKKLSFLTNYYLRYLTWITMNNLRPLFSTVFSMTRISLMNNEKLVYSPATFNSLNTGSLFTGAENRLCNFLRH